MPMPWPWRRMARDLYVASGWPYPAAQLLIIDTATRATIASIPYVGGTYGMAITPDGSRVYISSIDTIGSTDYPRIKVFDTATNVFLPPIDVGPPYLSSGARLGIFPVSLDVSPDGSRLYMSDFWSAKIVVIATATNTVVTTVDALPGTPSVIGFSVRASRDGTRALLGTNMSTHILNAQTNA